MLESCVDERRRGDPPNCQLEEKNKRGTPMPRSFTATSIMLIPKNDSPQPWVKWKFVYAILEKMGFPARFIALIKHAIEHYWFTILVNGEPSGFFKSLQGLRQCDAISPALVIIALEALSRGLNDLFAQNPDMLYQTGCKTRVTHLAYVDDIIIFTRCEEQSLNKLMQFLDLYENQSGQKINHFKSFFTTSEKANLIAHRIKSITGFNLKCLPITYLGAPLYKGYKKKILFEPLLIKSETGSVDGSIDTFHFNSSKVFCLPCLFAFFKC
ncbi:hypothetical protein Sango_2875100 [Sesamum angolense]|uniref:Reverse transcriptase domain-containing protein n=1 Tax=Sesamum angolense TaxID=2727404 RepID=A0AAE1T6I8_9LAMI|nr:hypothetical protein Sango_2875100 [Sesamum angolense]